jgi:hypothetical protein
MTITFIPTEHVNSLHECIHCNDPCVAIVKHLELSYTPDKGEFRKQRKYKYYYEHLCRKCLGDLE